MKSSIFQIFALCHAAICILNIFDMSRLVSFLLNSHLYFFWAAFVICEIDATQSISPYNILCGHMNLTPHNVIEQGTLNTVTSIQERKPISK